MLWALGFLMRRRDLNHSWALLSTCNEGETASWVPKFCYFPSVAPLNKFTSNCREINSCDYPDPTETRCPWNSCPKINPSNAEQAVKGPSAEKPCHPLFHTGQMMWMESLQCMLYLCSPLLRTLHELEERQMHIADIAPHDVTRDLILLNQQRLAEMELSNQLERKKEELRILSKHLEEEKKKTEALLYAMLPQHVANQLKEGKRVEAGEWTGCIWDVWFVHQETGELAQPLCHSSGVPSLLGDIHGQEDDHWHLILLIIKIRLFFQRKLWKLFAKIVP